MPKSTVKADTRSERAKVSPKGNHKYKKHDVLKTRSFLLGETERKWLTYQSNQTQAIKRLIKIAINTYGFSDLDDDLTKSITFSNGQTIQVRNDSVSTVRSFSDRKSKIEKTTEKPQPKKKPSSKLQNDSSVSYKKEHEKSEIKHNKHDAEFSRGINSKPKIPPKPTTNSFKKPNLNANISSKNTKKASASDDFSSWLGGDYSDSVKNKNKF